MDQLLTQVVADELAQEQSHVAQVLLHHDWCLLVIVHHVGVLSLRVNRSMHTLHLRFDSAELFLVFDLQQLLDHDWTFFLCTNEVGLMPGRLRLV